MTINQAIQRLIELREKHGDVDVVTDCVHCGKATAPTVIVTGPPVVRLQTAVQGGIIDALKLDGP